MVPMFIAGERRDNRKFDPLLMTFTNESAHAHPFHVVIAGLRGRRAP